THLHQLWDRLKDIYKLDINKQEFLELNSISSIATYLFDQYPEVKTILLSTLQEEEIERELKGHKLNLNNLAYTLQVGREAMEERVIFLARSISELTNKLECFLNGEKTIENCWTGHVKQENEIVRLLTGDEDSQDLVHKWITKNKLGKISQLWVSGYTVDWELFYGNTKPKRVSLPTYPFAREHYPLPTVNDRINLSIPNTAHPLLHENISDLFRQKYSSNFTGEEFFFRDYVANDERILPAAPYLEMARAAVESASGKLKEKKGMKLKNIVWDKPISINNETINVNIEVCKEDNEDITFKVYSENKNADEIPTVHCYGSGNWSLIKETPTIDIETLKSQFDRTSLTGRQCYELYKDRGIKYGSGYQGIKSLYKEEGQILVKLKLPSSVSDSINQFVLHPSILDSTLQASIGFMMNNGSVNKKSYFNPSSPISLENLEIFGECKPTMWGMIKKCDTTKGTEHKFNIDICDEQGKVYIRMKGLTYVKDMQSFNHQSKMKPDKESTFPTIADKPKGILLRDLSEKRDVPIPSIVQTEPSTSLSLTEENSKVSMPLPDVQTSMQMESLEKELTASLADILYIKTEDIDTDKKFIDIGLDSIIAVEWIRVINKQYGTSIVTSNIYDYPSVRALAGFLEKEVNKQTPCLIQPESQSNTTISDKSKEISLRNLSKKQDVPIPSIVQTEPSTSLSLTEENSKVSMPLPDVQTSMQMESLEKEL
ncbi:polyketide synthase dehydratase domain-containing protein, partial [Priestia megaterium]